jgi:hypothetical protein
MCAAYIAGCEPRAYSRKALDSIRAEGPGNSRRSLVEIVQWRIFPVAPEFTFVSTNLQNHLPIK